MRRTLYLPLLIAATAALTGLLAPASSIAATSCPPGQVANSKGYCEAEPPPPVTTTSIANELESGEVGVTFNVNGEGELTVKGKAVKTQKIKVTKSGKIEVVLTATGDVLKHLENKGWTKRKQIYATFTAADGTTSTVKVVVRFRKP